MVRSTRTGESTSLPSRDSTINTHKRSRGRVRVETETATHERNRNKSTSEALAPDERLNGAVPGTTLVKEIGSGGGGGMRRYEVRLMYYNIHVYT